MRIIRAIEANWVARQANALYLFAIPAGAAIAGSAVSVLVIAAFVWNVVGILTGNMRVPRDRHLLIYACVLFAYFLLRFTSVFMSADPGNNPLDALQPAVFLAFLPIVAALCRAPVAKSIELFARGAAVGAVAGAALAVFQVYALDMARAEGGAGNPGPFALIMAVSGGLSLILAAEPGRRERLLGLAGWVCGTLGVLLAGSKGMIPALLINTAIGAIYLLKQKSSLISLKSVMLAIVLTTAMIAVALPVINWRLVQLKDDIANAEQGRLVRSGGARLVMWKEGLDVFLEAPVLGHGYNMRAKAVETEVRKRTGESPGSHLHNSFVTDLVGNGVLGLVTHLAVLFAPFWLVLGFARERQYEKIRTMLMIVVASYIVSDMTSLTFGHDIMQCWFVFFMCTAMSALGQTETQPSRGLAGQDTKFAPEPVEWQERVGENSGLPPQHR